ncbi:GspH/FimT family pseudopilin [Marinobacterium weihaiense]|uniref:GspH/FimT family pseudopilin n=1 Tax=Marinobacterium weihaiense TaxID=2851016 RepID=A0ABS6MC73_9GAMM|nr:GspH/FimT family pseudopilin [Marinobacterium weihaiense]MBV0933884.1 GspH/FimT family pseudopilin [Marinobacterium weihaiense]
MEDQPKPSVPRQRGLTLVELLLTVTILSILAALGPPSFTQLVASSRLGATEADIVSLLSQARSAALMRNRRVVMCASDDGAQCQGSRRQGSRNWTGALLFVDLDQNRIVSNDETVFYVANFSSAATILWNRGDSLVYQPDGTALGGSNGTFVIRAPNTDHEHQVVVSLLGRARVVRKAP